MLIAVPDLRALDTSQHQRLQSAYGVLGWIPRRRARKNLCAAFDRLSIQMRGEHGGRANPVQGGRSHRADLARRRVLVREALIK